MKTRKAPRRRQPSARRALTAADLVRPSSARPGEPTAGDVLAGKAGRVAQLEMEIAIERAQHAIVLRPFVDKFKAERQRGADTAKQRATKRAKRDRDIAALALKLARESDELSDNPKMLPAAVLRHWRGQPIAQATVRRILSEQKVASTLRQRRDK